MAESDRLVLRALHLLYAAGRGPPLCSILPQSLHQGAGGMRKSDAGGGILFFTSGNQ